MTQKIVIFIISILDYFHNKKIINFLKKNKYNNFNLIFDVGAHKGESIKLFLKHLKVNEIISFEASPINFSFLEKKHKKLKKKFQKTKIKIENIALGSESKKVTLKQLEESSSSTINQINKNSLYFKKKFKILNLFHHKELYQPIEIKLETLDNYLNQHNLTKVDFLKIDTEGYEYEVLLGLKTKIKSIKLIMFEHHYDNMIRKNYSFREIRNLLKENNFKMIFKAKMPLRKTFEYIFINNGLIN
tara:strand:+ start:4446 stop:5180 length:735 start_codon:yes stop_codon:yes gene_type:complete